MSPPSDDLRQRVDELEATVRGLTQELVEATERIRQLEDAEEDSDAAGTDEEVEPVGQPADQVTGAESVVGTENDSEPPSEGNPEQEEDDVDDIIVA